MPQSSSANGVVQRQRTPKELGLKSPSFVPIDSEITTRRAVLIVMGGQKSGKTDWCLRHLPGPIVVFNFDNGLEGVAEKFTKKKQIIACGIKDNPKQKYPSYHFARPVPKGLGRKDPKFLAHVRMVALPIWERFLTDYAEALQSKARSLVIDTGGAAFQLAKFAFIGMDKYGSKDDPYGQKGGEMKSIFQGLMCDGYNYDKNVVWIHREKAVWAGGEPTNKMQVDGYSQAPYEVQFTLRVTRKQVKDEAVFAGEIRDCRVGNGVKNNGLKFGGDEREENPPMSFGSIMTTLLPRTEEEEWVG